ncbi:gustatory receptor for sugar taste 43a-like [Drosophila kikkawai]|uniref:Gustatory receptor n=1 Tax=Drosophila kikkawai TaxID=30033 RepID=A0ABM3C657_DROKI|nr:gustatory receptor for sugar taste 43a-like [Drosophila kikkawai]
MVTYLHQKKVFGVLLNRKHTVVRQLDIYDQVGRGSAHDEIVYFKINNGRLNYEGEVSDVRNGRLRLDFIKGALDNPKINAFALLKGDVSQMPRLHGTEAKTVASTVITRNRNRRTLRNLTVDPVSQIRTPWTTLPYCCYGLGRRFARLNRMLDSSFLGDHKECASSKPLKVNAVKTISMKPLAMPTALHASLTKLNSETLPSESTAKNKGLLLKAMADSHESLGKCVLLLSKWDLPLFSLDPASFGVAVLFIMVSCLLHLVATAYFLFLELLSKRDNGYLWVQMLWICFHFLRLLMVVEPCHLAARESRKTIQIVCEIERKVHEPILAEAVKKFWQQLLVVDADFSACGLCRVNRTILTSFASAIATYLVILIQFQRTNG